MIFLQQPLPAIYLYVNNYKDKNLDANL